MQDIDLLLLLKALTQGECEYRDALALQIASVTSLECGTAHTPSWCFQSSLRRSLALHHRALA